MQLGTMFRQHPLIGSVVEIAAAGICAMMSSGGCVLSIAAVLSSMVAIIEGGIEKVLAK
jgi:hypothetical protein